MYYLATLIYFHVYTEGSVHLIKQEAEIHMHKIHMQCYPKVFLALQLHLC